MMCFTVWLKKFSLTHSPLPPVLSFSQKIPSLLSFCFVLGFALWPTGSNHCHSWSFGRGATGASLIHQWLQHWRKWLLLWLHVTHLGEAPQALPSLWLTISRFSLAQAFFRKWVPQPCLAYKTAFHCPCPQPLTLKLLFPLFHNVP